MPIAPFNESPPPRPNITVKSRPGTSVPPQFRQGIEITSATFQNRGLYTISSGELNGTLAVTVFGQALEGESTTTFDDTAKITALIEIDDNPLASTAQARFAEDNIDSTDGVIEPLTIRAIANFSNITGHEVDHGVKGQVQSGNANVKDNANTISQFIALKNNPEPFLDGQDHFGPVVLPIARWDVPRISSPFDATAVRKKAVKLSNDMGSDMQLALLAMAPIANTLIPAGEISATAGFMFNDAPQGTDSIAFI